MKGRYPDKERSGMSGSDCSGSEVDILVNGRLQVEVRSSNVCGLTLFHKHINAMDLVKLPK